MARLIVVLIPLILACNPAEKSEPPSPPPPAAPAPVLAPVPVPVPAPVPQPTPVPAAPSRPKNAEVEAHGKVDVPKSVKNPVRVFVSTADCLDPEGKILGHVDIAFNGGFFLEVFPPWGSDLTYCAAEIPPDGKPSMWYGKARGKFHAEQEGEVYFGNMSIPMARGKPKSFKW